MTNGLLIGGAGYALALVAGALFLDAREDLAAERERCNSDKLAAIAEAERVTRETVEVWARQREAQLAHRLEVESEARRIAEAATSAALARADRVAAAIGEASNDEPCMDRAIPSTVLDELR